MSKVQALGYIVIETAQSEEWRRFGTEVCGMQLGSVTPTSMDFRLDSRASRMQIQAGDQERVLALGWEVAGPKALANLKDSLVSAGYEVTSGNAELCAARGVTELAYLMDPDGIARLELFYGAQESLDRFVSPTGASFITGDGGLGHVFQIVKNREEYSRLYEDILGFRLSDIIWSPKRQADLHFLHCNPRHHSFAFAEISGLEPALGHLMFEVADIDTVGRAYDKVLDGEAPLITTFGRHTNDEMLSFYVRTPSGFGLEYGYGGVRIGDDWLPARYDDAHYWGHRRVDPVDLQDPADVE